MSLNYCGNSGMQPCSARRAYPAIAHVAPDGSLFRVNERLCDITGYQQEELCARTYRDITHPDDLEPSLAQYHRLLLGEIGNYNLDKRYLCKDDSIVWVRLTVDPVRKANGEVVYVIGTIEDISEQKRAQEALRGSQAKIEMLRSSEARLRHLSDNLPGSAIYRYTREADGRPRFEYISAGIERLNGVHPDDVLRDPNVLLGQVPEEYLQQIIEAERRSAAEMSDLRFERPERRPDGEVRWMLLESRPQRGEDGSVYWEGVKTDITDRKHLEEHVNHCSMNLLAVVQSVARQTAAAKPDDFLECFTKRIEALAANQDLFIKNKWKGADLEELVRSQLVHFENLIGTRIEIKGSPRFVYARAAQALSMALCELATNAAKYGALSHGEGRVGIEWKLEHDGSENETFIMSWREHSPRAIIEPSKRGFGSTVIGEMAEMSLGAKVELDFRAPGVHWRLQCSCSEVLEKNQQRRREAPKTD